jgi:hypothetical protein
MYCDGDEGFRGGNETYVLDINDHKEILGWTLNFDTWEGQPFIGRPALASGN